VTWSTEAGRASVFWGPEVEKLKSGLPLSPGEFDLGGYLLALIIIFGLSTLLTFVMQFLYLSVCLCCLIPILMAPIAFYLMLVTNTLYARAYRTGAQNLAARAD